MPCPLAEGVKLNLQQHISTNPLLKDGFLGLVFTPNALRPDTRPWWIVQHGRSPPRREFSS
jgi:hypothetical protein